METSGDSDATLCQKRFLYSKLFQRQDFYVTNYIFLLLNVSQQGGIAVFLIFDISVEGKEACAVIVHIKALFLLVEFHSLL